MKKFILLLVCTIGLHPLLAQNKGIAFENLSLKEACAKAQKEGKKVFIDCFTKTCGPCKYMMKNIFPLEECGEYFNPRYVSLAQDIDEGDGPEIKQKYNVGIYPTFLIVNPDGSLYCKEMGGVTLNSQITFVQKMQRAVKTVEMGSQYQAGKRDVDFVSEYIEMLKASGSEQLPSVINETLVPLDVKDLCSDAYWKIMQTEVNTTDSQAFRKLFDNRKECIALLGRDAVEGKIMQTYRNEFAMYKSMDMDFSQRIADLKILEKEDYKGALALRYCQTLKDIIYYKRTDRAAEVVTILQTLSKRLSDEGERMSVIRELVRFERIANASQKKKVVAALQKLKTACTSERNADEISRMISRLSATR